MSLNTGSNIVTVAAGNGTVGGGPYMLNEPNGIFVDDEFTLYVADCGNSRVQLFKPGVLSGSTVQVSGIYGSLTLHCPTAVWLDGNGYLFIVDLDNIRILGSGPTGFRCLVGCSGTSGSASYQLNAPRSLAFDSYGNMFVADTNNGRIQKFFLATNSCGKYN
jgi:sugar lactone lactonase YvrE